MRWTRDQPPAELGSTRWLLLITHDLDSLFWAVIYKPFRAQSIGIYKVTNGFMVAAMDEEQNLMFTMHQFLQELHTPLTSAVGSALGRYVHGVTGQ